MYVFVDSADPGKRYVLYVSESLMVKYTNDDLKRLIDGPRIPAGPAVRALPFELQDHLARMREYQRALRRQGSTSPILPPGAMIDNG